MFHWAIRVTVPAAILTAIGGCGSGSGSSPTPDGSTVMASSADAGAEASLEAGPVGPDCGAMPPTGTQLVAATDPLVILTLTTDQIVYEDLTTQELYAVPVAGGPPSDVGKMTSQGATVWAHSATLLYLPVAADPMTGIAPLSSWTPGAGTSVITKSAVAADTYVYTYDASKDGQYVAYFATSNGATATLTVSTIDGKTQTSLASEIDLTDESCFPPTLQFVNDTVIAQYCQTPPPDGGRAGRATIAAFTGPTFSAVTFGSTFPPSPGPIAVDPTGTLALLLGPSATGLYLYPLSGGTAVTVDPQGTTGLFTPTGDILYTTSTTSLARYTVASGTITALVPVGLRIPLVLSPDGNWLQVAEGLNETTEQTDLYLASATTPGTASAVIKTATASAAGFTADSNYSLFGTGFPTNFGSVTYTLEASKSSGGAATKVLAAAGAVLYTTGSKIVCNTNQSKTTGSADIVSLDVSTTGAPATLVTQADPNLFLTSTSDVVYSWYCNESAMAGIWTLTPP